MVDASLQGRIYGVSRLDAPGQAYSVWRRSSCFSKCHSKLSPKLQPLCPECIAGRRQRLRMGERIESASCYKTQGRNSIFASLSRLYLAASRLIMPTSCR